LRIAMPPLVNLILSKATAGTASVLIASGGLIFLHNGRSASSRGALVSECCHGPFTRLGNLDTPLQVAEKSFAW
jgi:hypothetical protein